MEQAHREEGRQEESCGHPDGQVQPGAGWGTPKGSTSLGCYSPRVVKSFRMVIKLRIFLARKKSARYPARLLRTQHSR